MKETFDLLDIAVSVAFMLIVSMAWLTYRINNAPFDADDDTDDGYDLTKTDSD